MQTKLIIVEGLPSSGKSTAAKFAAGVTGGKCFDEDCGNHPADYEFHSFLSENVLKEFSDCEQKIILSNAFKKAGVYAVPLTAVKGELFDKLLQYKIYDFLDWETERRVMLDKWKEFAEIYSGGIYVFNCVLMQNPMCETMMRFNFDSVVSKEYINEICEIVKPLSPVVIYLKNDDIESSIRSAVKERGQEWLDAVIDYHCNGGYGKSNGLKGLNGYIKALEECQKRELKILESLPVKRLILDNPQRDWNKSYAVLTEFFKEC